MTAQALSQKVHALFQYLWKEKWWWIIPFVVTLVAIAVLLVFAKSSPVAPFLYTAF